MKSLLVAGILIATLSGCATRNAQTLPFSQTTASKYKGRSITYTVQDSPSFIAMTAGKATLGPFGVPLMCSKGNKIIRANDVKDPSERIGAVLTQDLATKYDLTINPFCKQTTVKDGGADLVLEIQTTGWGFGYLTFDWNNYWVSYSVKLRLIDTRSSAVLAEGSSRYYSADNNHYPSYKQLVNNNAAGLKNEMEKAKNKCVSELGRNVFSVR